MLDRLCIAVDGSADARRAAAVGIAIAEGVDASVDVVRVVSEEEREGERGEGGAEWDGSRVLSDLDESADAATVPVEGHALEGSPAEAIVQFAAESDADLLVLGRSGRGGIGDRLLGSVVHSVLRNADQPVLTVPSGEGPVELSDVLVPTDGSEAAERAAPVAAEIAAGLGATVHACYVLDLAKEGGLFSAGGATEEEIQRFEENRREHLDRLAELLHERRSELSVESAIVRDEAHSGIAEYIAEAGVDLVVMGSKRSASAIGQVAGSVTDKVLESVDVPVLVVRADRD